MKKLLLCLSTFAGVALLFPAKIARSSIDHEKIKNWSTEFIQSSDLPCDVPKPYIFNLHERRTPENAYLMMAASHLAYRFLPGKRERILKNWGFSHVQLFDDSSTSTNGFWAEQNEFVLLVFRGTQEPTDILTDVDVVLEPSPSEWKISGRTHRGFTSGALSVRKYAKTAAIYAQKINKPLLLTGHSLGGAIAALTAVELERNQLPVHTVWSFGAPKMGDTDFTRSVQRMLGDRWQTLNQPNDPIPLLPFANRDKPALNRLAEKFGSVLPLIDTLAAHAAYDSDTRSNSQKKFITETSLMDFARGFWKHLPRSYVCDLANRSLALH